VCRLDGAAMTPFFRSSVAFAALAVGLMGATTVSSSTTERDGPIVFDTSFVTAITKTAGAYVGEMRLSIARDGTVTGVYRPIDGSFTDVTGGVDGTSIHLDIQGAGRVHITGSYRGGVIDGSSWSSGQLLDFTARPRTS